MTTPSNAELPSPTQEALDAAKRMGLTDPRAVAVFAAIYDEDLCDGGVLGQEWTEKLTRKILAASSHPKGEASPPQPGVLEEIRKRHKANSYADSGELLWSAEHDKSLIQQAFEAGAQAHLDRATLLTLLSSPHPVSASVNAEMLAALEAAREMIGEISGAVNHASAETQNCPSEPWEKVYDLWFDGAMASYRDQIETAISRAKSSQGAAENTLAELRQRNSDLSYMAGERDILWAAMQDIADYDDGTKSYINGECGSKASRAIEAVNTLRSKKP